MDLGHFWPVSLPPSLRLVGVQTAAAAAAEEEEEEEVHVCVCVAQGRESMSG